jgi:ferredoxin-thioredoxin reductase catalytic subunit/rubredoxin
MITFEKVKQRAEIDAKTHGYHLTPDLEMLKDLLIGLKKNEDRYGYPSCPCRIASGIFEIDRDIICPCDYRDPDVMEYGACYCNLYVDAKTYESKELKPVPERRPIDKLNRAVKGIGKKPREEKQETKAETAETLRELWYCKQCGYVTFREEPTYVCPICRAKRELFARINTDK